VLIIKRICVTILFLTFALNLAKPQTWKQERLEIAAGFGSASLFSDIGGYSNGKNAGGFRDLYISRTRYNINMNIKYRIYQRFSIRLSLTSGKLMASDALGTNDYRGYVAGISVFEPAAIGELYFLKRKYESNYLFARRKPKTLQKFINSTDIYFLSGIGGVRYRIDQNEKMVESGLRTGGFAPVIPFGIGTVISIKENFGLGLEFAGRYSMSDYIEAILRNSQKRMISIISLICRPFLN
jgi:hypothetical protein